MYSNSTPENWDPEKFLETWSSMGNPVDKHQTITSTSTSIDPDKWKRSVVENTYKSPVVLLEERVKKLELDNKLLRLKMLSMEGKFTQDEITNIRKMLMSNDEASITLADSIIENA